MNVLEGLGMGNREDGVEMRGHSEKFMCVFEVLQVKHKFTLFSMNYLDLILLH